MAKETIKIIKEAYREEFEGSNDIVDVEKEEEMYTREETVQEVVNIEEVDAIMKVRSNEANYGSSRQEKEVQSSTNSAMHDLKLMVEGLNEAVKTQLQ